MSEHDLRTEVVRLTDWHVDELFSWIPEIGGALFASALSRLVFDPERFADDDEEPMADAGQGVVYTKTTDGEQLAQISIKERERRIRDLYNPYHEALAALVPSMLQQFGTALILDCHSFATVPLPSEIDQSPDRPDICIGTSPYHTPAELSAGLVAAFESEGLTVELDRPFPGTLVPRRFLGTDSRVRSVMIEVRRGLYCDESSGERGPGFESTRSALQRAVTAGIAPTLSTV